MTTIVSVRRGNQVALAGDGQVSLGNTVMKGNASKVRRLYRGKVLAGFAGGTADAFTLFERFEAQLEKYQGHLTKAAVELAKDEDYQGYIVQGGEDKTRTNDFLSILKQHQINAYPVKEGLKAEGKNFTANSYFVPLAQPQYRLVKAIFS